MGCAEVKGQRIQTAVESQTDTSHWDDTVKNITELSSNQVCAATPTDPDHRFILLSFKWISFSIFKNKILMLAVQSLLRFVDIMQYHISVDHYLSLGES